MTPPTLQRFVGVRALSLTIITMTVGAGIFGMPALAAHDLGASAVLAYLACAVIIGLVGLCLAEAGSRVAGTGGLYAFATASFGSFAGGMVGMLLFTANGAFSCAAVAALFADTVGMLLPALAAPIPRALVLIATFGAFATLHIRGAREGVAAAQLITVVKLLPLLLLVVAGVFFINPDNMRWTVTPTLGAVTHASTLLVFAFIGIEGALSLSGEVAAPARTIPRAILVAMTGVVLLYIGVQTVAQGVLGDALRGESTAPLADTARVIFGSAGATLILVATIISTLGYIAADTTAAPRVLLALGEDGFLPKRVGSVHPKRQTPAVAIACYIALALTLALTGTFAALAVIASSGTLAMYLICCVGVLRLRAKGIRGTEPPFVIPGGPLVPLLASLGILGLLSSLARKEVYALGLVVLVCAVPWAIRRGRMNAQRTESIAVGDA